MIFWKQYTATVTKSAIKPVACETCGTHFEYEVVRRAKGYSDSIYCLDNRGAEERSLRYAHRACDKQLAKAVTLMPCPRCGWFQKNMVRAGKKKRLLYTALAAFPVSWAVFIATAVNETSATQNELPFTLSTIAFCITAAIGVAWFFWYDPNRLLRNRAVEK